MSLPVILLALSFHETAHGYLAYKCGDNTARSLGRLTLNPIKHLDPIGFLCMLIFHFGWAKPVPVNTRNFKNPKRDMALVGAAGPLSNLLLALIFTALLRLSLLAVDLFGGGMIETLYADITRGAGNVPILYTVIAFLIYMLELGVVLNIHLAIFNLLPVPPLDGSRILYVFLPPKLYFGVMKYERYIALAIFVLLYLGVLSTPISWVSQKITDFYFWIFRMPSGSFNVLMYHAMQKLILF